MRNDQCTRRGRRERDATLFRPGPFPSAATAPLPPCWPPTARRAPGQRLPDRAGRRRAPYRNARAESHRAGCSFVWAWQWATRRRSRNWIRCRGTPDAPQPVERSPLIDGRLEELGQRGRRRDDAGRLHPLRGDVVERLARPFQRWDKILPVEPSPLMEGLVFPLDEPVELEGQEQLEAQARRLRTCRGASATAPVRRRGRRQPVDQQRGLGLQPIDDHHHALHSPPPTARPAGLPKSS